jgi:hypothetical protein
LDGVAALMEAVLHSSLNAQDGNAVTLFFSFFDQATGAPEELDEVRAPPFLELLILVVTVWPPSMPPPTLGPSAWLMWRAFVRVSRAHSVYGIVLRLRPGPCRW